MTGDYDEETFRRDPRLIAAAQIMEPDPPPGLSLDEFLSKIHGEEAK